MISEIQIENFKSIAKLSLKPGSVTVLIGENGSGKSNILEAIAFAAAASAGKLDDEFLYSRGIRVTEKEWMRSAFIKPRGIRKDSSPIPSPVSMKVLGADSRHPLEMVIQEVVTPLRSKMTGRWSVGFAVDPSEMEAEYNEADFMEEVEVFKTALSPQLPAEAIERAAMQIVARRRVALRKRKSAPEISAALALKDFLIYAPREHRIA